MPLRFSYLKHMAELKDFSLEELVKAREEIQLEIDIRTERRRHRQLSAEEYREFQLKKPYCICPDPVKSTHGDNCVRCMRRM